MAKSESDVQIALVIINWNNYEDTNECLNSLCGLVEAPKVFLVDNASIDGSYEILRNENYETLEITFIRNDFNLGFAEGNNIGIRLALQEEYKIVVLLNNDTTVDPKFLKYLAQIFEEDKEVGIVGSINFYYSNPSRVWASGAVMENWWTRRAIDITAEKEDLSLVPNVREVDYVPGSAIAIKREVFDVIGLLDARFFYYFEETDFCISAKESGFKVVSSLKSKIYHKVGRSSIKNDQNSASIGDYFYLRNEILFQLKHRSSMTDVIPICVIWLFKNLKAMLISALKIDIKQFVIRFISFRDAVLLRYGRGSIDKVIHILKN